MPRTVIASGSSAPAATQARALLDGSTYGVAQQDAGRRLLLAALVPDVRTLSRTTIAGPTNAPPAATQARALLDGSTYGVLEEDPGRRLFKAVVAFYFDAPSEAATPTGVRVAGVAPAPAAGGPARGHARPTRLPARAPDVPIPPHLAGVRVVPDRVPRHGALWSRTLPLRRPTRTFPPHLAGARVVPDRVPRHGGQAVRPTPRALSNPDPTAGGLRGVRALPDTRPRHAALALRPLPLPRPTTTPPAPLLGARVRGDARPRHGALAGWARPPRPLPPPNPSPLALKMLTGGLWEPRMYTFAPGAAGKGVHFLLRDAATAQPKTALVAASAGALASYARAGGSVVPVTLSDLASAAAPWSAGGFKELDAAGAPGLYRLDLPDAALAAGTAFVTVSLGFTGVLGEAALVLLQQPLSNLGSGAVAWQIQINKSTGGPLPNAEVWVTTDAGGAAVAAGVLVSSDAGVVTVMLDPGVYYLWVTERGFDRQNPTPFTVTA